MNIIALYGNGDSGKTTVLKLFLARVIEEYGAKVIESSGEDMSPKTLRKQLDLFEAAKKRGFDYESHDAYASVEIGGKKIGITTMGDSESELREQLERFSDCDLIFCAARSKGETLAHLRKVTKKGSLILHRQHQVLCENVKNAQIRQVNANISMVRSLSEELKYFLE